MRAMTPLAVISDCGLYRYKLSRSWGNGRHLTFIMLNPSTADALADDPTIRRCIGFAKREGMDGIHVLNLFAFRATKPERMHDAFDPAGPENHRYLDDAIGFSIYANRPIVCAWGSHWMAKDAGQSLIDRMHINGAQPICLGFTKNWAPRHPLYVKGDAELVSILPNAPDRGETP